MTLVPAAVILVAREADAHSRRTVFSYVAITHLGGVGTWVAVLLLPEPGAVGDACAIASGSGLQMAIALAALFGMGTKAGVMPLHVWLPRAHPIAPAPVSALMSGVMIKVAMYGAHARARRMGSAYCRSGSACSCWPSGALSASAESYALFQHELKRLLALHSIENIGIIVLGLGACLVLRAHGADQWAAFALARGAAAHPEPRGLQGAAVPRRGRRRAGDRHPRARPARRPAAADAVDRRRLRDRGDGHRRAAAAQRVRLRMGDPAGAAARPANGRRRRRRRRGARAGRARRDCGPGGDCFVKVVGLALLGPPRGEPSPRRRGGAGAMAAPIGLPRGGVHRARCRSRACCSRPLAGSAPVADDLAARGSGCSCQVPDRCRRAGSHSCSWR